MWKRIDCVLSGVLVAGWCFGWWNFRAQYTKAEQLGCELFGGSSCGGQIIRCGLPFELASHWRKQLKVNCRAGLWSFTNLASLLISLSFSVSVQPVYLSGISYIFRTPSCLEQTVAEQKEDNSICFRIGKRSNGKLIDKSAAELQMNTSKSYKRRITAVTPLSRDSIAAVGKTNLAESYWTITAQADGLLRSWRAITQEPITVNPEIQKWSFLLFKAFYLKGGLRENVLYI